MPCNAYSTKWRRSTIFTGLLFVMVGCAQTGKVATAPIRSCDKIVLHDHGPDEVDGIVRSFKSSARTFAVTDPNAIREIGAVLENHLWKPDKLYTRPSTRFTLAIERGDDTLGHFFFFSPGNDSKTAYVETRIGKKIYNTEITESEFEQIMNRAGWSDSDWRLATQYRPYE